MNRLYDVTDVGTVQIALSDAPSSSSAARAITHQLFFPRTRDLVSSFSIPIVARLLSSGPRVYSSPFPTSLPTHVPREMPVARGPA